MNQPEPAADVAHSRGPSRSELTPTSQFERELSPSPPASPQLAIHHDYTRFRQADSLTFPLLESDGSLPDLRELSFSPPRFRTTPAALSSLAARMAAAQDLESSVESLEGHYDMMEDVSEVSTEDGRETASLTSTDHDGEGELTPDEDDAVDENGQDTDMDFGSVGDLAGTLRVNQEQIEANRILDSYMTDDMDTPRQSLIRPPEPATATSARQPASSGSNFGPQRVGLDIVLYIHNEESADFVEAVGTRIATYLGAQGVCEHLQLPKTPDNHEGTCLFRYDNLDVTVTEGDTATKNHGAPDLSVLLVSEVHEDPVALSRSFAGAGSQAPLLIITKTERQAKLLGVSMANMVASQRSFFGGEEKTSLRLRRLLGGTMMAKGWHSWPTSSYKKHIDWFAPLAWKRVIDAGLIRTAIAFLCLVLFLSTVTPTSTLDKTATNQRERLVTSLTQWTGRHDWNLSESADILLPDKRSPHGRTLMVVLPNQLAIAAPQLLDRQTSNSSDVKVTRSPDTGVAFDFIMLGPGIFGVTIPIEDTHGNISVSIPTHARSRSRKAVSAVKFNHDFGVIIKPPQNSYQKASMDLAKAINKDVAVARKAAKSLTNTFSHELSATVVNVTSQLAVRMTRDVQLFANMTSDTLTNIKTKASPAFKDVRKDLIKSVDDIKKSVATTARNVKDLIVPSKEILASPLAVSRQRASELKDTFAGKKAGCNTKTKADTKPLSACKKPRVDREPKNPSNEFEKPLAQVVRESKKARDSHGLLGLKQLSEGYPAQMGQEAGAERVPSTEMHRAAAAPAARRPAGVIRALREELFGYEEA